MEFRKSQKGEKIYFQRLLKWDEGHRRWTDKSDCSSRQMLSKGTCPYQLGKTAVTARREETKIPPTCPSNIPVAAQESSNSQHRAVAFVHCAAFFTKMNRSIDEHPTLLQIIDISLWSEGD